MAGVESKHDQIVEALRAHLAGIESDHGVTYWYTPDRVEGTLFLSREWLDSSLEYLIFLVPGLEVHLEGSSQQVDAEMEMFLMIARRHTPPTENPLVEHDPTRWKLINRCAKDVLKKLWAWKDNDDLRRLIYNISKPEEGILIDRVKEVKNWAVQEFRFTPLYRYPRSTP